MTGAPASPTRASRRALRTSSCSARSFCLRTSLAVDLEQDVRAALQVEPEHDVALRPGGQRLTVLSGKKLGTANRQTMNAVSRIAVAFHFEI